MSHDQDSVDHELGKQQFGKPNDLPKVTDFGAGYRTRNLAEDNMTEALIEEEKLFQEKIGKDPLIGQVLDDKYHILEVLGFGGMSVVYKAMQEPVERLVAVKTVKFRVDERPDIWRRFEREVKTLSKLSHPNVVTVYDCVIGRDSQPYVVMDYLKGSSLDQVLLNGRFTLEQTYSVASQICLGVGHAHRHEVIHRDIKPANIMLLDGTASGVYRLEEAGQQQVKVVDFGLAKLGEDSRKLTHSGELWGSPPYMSPEQISGRECDSRADIYSLGCVIYEMLTGKDPFWGANVYELLHCHMHNQAPTLASACPEGQFPVQLENVIARAMAKNPAERFATMIDFKDALEQACLHPDTSVKNFARPGTPGRVWSLADGQSSVVAGNQTNSYSNSAVSPFARPVPSDHEAVQSSADNSAAASHLLTYTLTVLMLAACILFAVNAGRGLEHTKVQRRVPDSATSSSANFDAAVNSPRTGSKSRQVTSESEGDNSAEDSDIKSQNRRGGRSRAALRRSAAFSGPRSNESVKKTIKDSSPNSPIGGVDQSKFELLRRLKSSASQN
ncbi:MAG: serine/threonine-protein kinase [Candidatus Melainabacteria bacterium]|nr:serine/threonine-protein kinase [Candidatus Melainabacteria bacterium]